MDVVLVLGGVAAGFVNTLAGGGSALTIPLLMLTGLDANQANGTNRIAVLLQSASGVGEFHRKGVRPWRVGLTALLPLVVSSLLGAAVATQIPAPALERLFGVVFLALAVVMAFRPNLLVPDPDAEVEPRSCTWRGAAGLFAVGLYGGIFQAGVGIPLLLVVVHALRLDIVAANAVKTGLVAVYTLLVVPIFHLQGQVVWSTGLLVASGTIVGSVVGVHFAVERGASFVRKLVLVALVLAGVHALGLW